MNETTKTFFSNPFLGSAVWQNLTDATVTQLFLYGSFFVEGILMVSGNILLICVIMAYKALRRKEMYILAGLAMADMLYGKL